MKSRTQNAVSHEAGDTGATVQRIFRASDMPAITGYTVDYIYELIADKQFPKPIKLGARAVGWLENEVAAWQRKRIAERDKAAA